MLEPKKDTINRARTHWRRSVVAESVNRSSFFELNVDSSVLWACEYGLWPPPRPDESFMNFWTKIFAILLLSTFLARVFSRLIRHGEERSPSSTFDLCCCCPENWKLIASVWPWTVSLVQPKKLNELQLRSRFDKSGERRLTKDYRGFEWLFDSFLFFSEYPIANEILIRLITAK